MKIIFTNLFALSKKEKLFKTMIKVSNALLKVNIDVRRKLFGNDLCIQIRFLERIELFFQGDGDTGIFQTHVLGADMFCRIDVAAFRL